MPPLATTALRLANVARALGTWFSFSVCVWRQPQCSSAQGAPRGLVVCCRRVLGSTWCVHGACSRGGLVVELRRARRRAGPQDGHAGQRPVVARSTGIHGCLCAVEAALKAPYSKRLGLAGGRRHVYDNPSQPLPARHLLQIGKHVRAVPLECAELPWAQKETGVRPLAASPCRGSPPCAGGVCSILGTPWRKHLPRRPAPPGLQVCCMQGQVPPSFDRAWWYLSATLGRPLAASFAVVVRSHA